MRRAAPIPARSVALLARSVVSDAHERGHRLPSPPSVGSLRAPGRPPAFIIGAPRSGTTFLGACIARAASVSYHFEPPVVRDAVRRVGRGEWDSRTAARVCRVSYRVLRLFDGKSATERVIDKTPENSFAVTLLVSAFPGAQFIHLVRDGRDVAVSLTEKGWLDDAGDGRSSPYVGRQPRFWVEPERAVEFADAGHLRRCAWAWRRYTEAALEARALPGAQYTEVRYEDLVARPEATASSIARFLDLPGRDRDAVADVACEARADSVGRWRARLSHDERAEVEAEAGKLLEDLGYDV